MYYIGIDLGTSACKGLLCDEKGKLIRTESREYPVCYPHPGWSEQNPDDWVRAAEEILASLGEGIADEIGGISFGGQMHGLVMLDEDDKVIRPAILWNDGRTKKEVEYLNGTVGKDVLAAETANIAFAGFTAPKVMWVKENEPENYKKIRRICLPKDYVAYKLTGVFSTDYSDAGGMLLLDVANKKWSEKMCALCSVDPAWLPKLYASSEVTGKLLPKYGMKNAVVTAGAGDNAAAAVGTGTVGQGGCNISLGTSGTVFISRDAFPADAGTALHVFPHADGGWHFLGCILSAASCLGWWLEKINGTDDYTVTPASPLGEGGVFFLPYMMGERSPHNDTDARGVFFGLTPDTTRDDMTVAVMEGVAFALRDCVEVARAGGLTVSETNLCGGGAKSTLWRQIIADVMNADVYMSESEQGPAFGAAILAAVGAGEYASVAEATDAIVKRTLVARPDPEAVARYEKKYRLFRRLYPALKDEFKAFAE